MKPALLFGWEHETEEAKDAWFQSLTLEDRFHVFSEFYDLAVALNPKMLEEDVSPTDPDIRVLRKA